MLRVVRRKVLHPSLRAAPEIISFASPCLQATARHSSGSSNGGCFAQTSLVPETCILGRTSPLLQARQRVVVVRWKGRAKNKVRVPHRQASCMFVWHSSKGLSRTRRQRVSPLRTERDSSLAHDLAGSVFGSWSTRHIRLQPTGRGNDAGILIFNNSPPAAGDVPRGSSVASLLGAVVERLPPDFDPLGSVLKLCHEGYDEDIHLRSVLP